MFGKKCKKNIYPNYWQRPPCHIPHVMLENVSLRCKKLKKKFENKSILDILSGQFGIKLAVKKVLIILA